MSSNRAALATPSRVHFWCPGCEAVHGISYADSKAVWAWNGSLELPTFSPSILVRLTHGNGLTREHPNYEEIEKVCHSFVNNGRIQFLNDSTHKLAGQTVDIPSWPYSDQDET